jgi:hypothetical protein
MRGKPAALRPADALRGRPHRSPDRSGTTDGVSFRLLADASIAAAILPATFVARLSVIFRRRPATAIPHFFRTRAYAATKRLSNLLTLLASPTGFEPVLPP